MKHSFRQLTDRNAVIQAIEEFIKLGREAFLRKYGFWKAKSYYILYRGEHYDSKAIVGAACGYQFGKPLSANDFSGGKYTVRPKLENLGFKVISMKIDDTSIALPEEVPDNFPEGAKRLISINAYERSPGARIACIEYHGSTCAICQFDFGSKYGEEFAGYIHVHHLTPLSKVNRSYIVNPKEDMIPVCPNCHAVVHGGGRVRTISQVRNMLKGL
jgi:5-methylcytosine-specific restriction enzyme A